ncbi:uncharacterized protein Z518_00351 [Rhinocladiella mackenziei CBS 650.93]|uniref:Uncharacterized protein n=1 Tax=Rhinocladiella mackenziei CBS 650.93 TaxID=1442369 RepID=A0A0D2G3S8_9EURO|nr:uncharacterized protein Z518_00351 [Rhinocladiella mackenziei CBS 650.93]KIX09272.1 hypothetical protein Z518_00351 [Rhinocladiella mackenziei CBS 650.93]
MAGAHTPSPALMDPASTSKAHVDLLHSDEMPSRTTYANVFPRLQPPSGHGIHSLSFSTTANADRLPNSRIQFRPLIKQPVLADPSGVEPRLKAILVRYYTEHLAHWFDLCDPLRHFATVVPLRARNSRPLMNAIFTVSARHLVRSSMHRDDSGIVFWQGNVLPELNEEKAVHFHNECIRELLQLSMDPDQVHNENLLAAAIILRTDEEMDVLCREDDDSGGGQVFLSLIYAYINAQVPSIAPFLHQSPITVFHSFSRDAIRAASERGPGPQTAYTPTAPGSELIAPSPAWMPPYDRITDSSIPRTTSQANPLRQACFWVACRQEVYASFIKQRPIILPLSRCGGLRELSPCEDHIWAMRMVVFCADVLNLCYGSSDSGNTKTPPLYADVDHWRRLQERDTAICATMPSSFEPTYYSASNLEAGECFPDVWYQESWHATGIAHMDLARILLTVFDPFLPRLGIGNVAAMRERDRLLRYIVLHLCGIAVSNWRSPPNSINAFVAIAMCGELFTDRREQTALLALLDSIQREFAYPTASIANELKETWTKI